jgi:hypothetical protein
VLFPAIPIIVGISYIVFYLPDNIEFDNEKIYIKRWNGSYTIDLKNIHMIKMTGLSIGHRNIWKIKYIVNNEENAARFYPRYFSSAFDDFVAQVKSKNPKVELIRFSWSLDFDM